MEPPNSSALFARALRVMPGGVNSPVRAFRSVGGTPLFMERGEGAYLVDVDGRRLLDHVMSWGALILGHAHPDVVDGLCQAAARGTSFGTPCADEIALAEAIQAAMPSVEQVRMVSSGTEAVMSALRVARAYTGRTKIVKFAGCYHGHADLLLVQAGSGVATLGLPNSPGVPPEVVADTLVARYNDAESVETLMSAHEDEVAAVIVEPVAGNMGMVPPEPGFLEDLRRLSTLHGALLIFDEVMTGFRVGPGGAQALFGVQPDMTTLGKVIGGGLPVGAFGGKREIMAMVAPEGPVYQAGTLSGNPLTMRAGVTTLLHLRNEDTWTRLEQTTRAVVAALQGSADAEGVSLTTHHAGAMFGFFLTEAPLRSWDDADRLDRQRFADFFRAMLESGVYLAPSPFEAGFVSTAHGPAEVELLRSAATGAFKRIGRA